jgi:hypothetical protein
MWSFYECVQSTPVKGHRRIASDTSTLQPGATPHRLSAFRFVYAALTSAIRKLYFFINSFRNDTGLSCMLVSCLWMQGVQGGQ